MDTIHTIHQGDQYIIPFTITSGGEAIEPSDVTGMRIQIGDQLQEYPDGDLTYDSTNGVWCFHLTEEMSSGMSSGRQAVQIGVKEGSSDTEIVYSDVFYIDVGASLIKESWLSNG